MADQVDTASTTSQTRAGLQIDEVAVNLDKHWRTEENPQS